MVPQDVRKIRIFVASPGDVAFERDALASIVEELNVSIGPTFDFVLELVRWETHARPAMGRPQAVINALIGVYDVFVGIMWKRFGTPTGVADSGTEEEFRIAFASWQANGKLPILFYFSRSKFMPSSQAELEQMGKVLAFRDTLNAQGLTWTYPSKSKFASTIRPHLTRLLCEMSTGAQANEPAAPQAVDSTGYRISPRPVPYGGSGRVGGSGMGFGSAAKDPASTPAAHLPQPDDELIAIFHELWPHFEPDLQDAFALAYNEQGDGVKTENLFAAIRSLDPSSVAPILDRIPDNALPTVTRADVDDDRAILEGRPWFSSCVTDSLRNMKVLAERGQKITAADMFVDIAKHGTGGSVLRLRRNGIDGLAIDKLMTDAGVTVLERDASGVTVRMPEG